MFKVVAFLTKREGLSMDEFIDYYESHHAPLLCRLAPTPPLYKRRYVRRDEEATGAGGKVDFDVMTELGFADAAGFAAWAAQVNAPETNDAVANDEARFLDRSKTRAYVIDERVTSG